MKSLDISITGWVVLNGGKLVVWEWEYGYPGKGGPVHSDSADARELARLHAERTDEIKSRDGNRWEGASMPMREVYRRGYRIRKVTLKGRAACQSVS